MENEKKYALTASAFETILSPVKDKALKLVDEQTFIREAGFALQLINSNPQLGGCTKESIMQAVYNTALTGLSLNPVLKYAYLIPRWSKEGTKCSLEPDYRGLVKLLTDTGSVKNLYCHLVYKGDVFEVTLGTDTSIIHTPKYQSRDVEKVYAVAILHDGSKQIEVMTAEEINAIRDLSESWKAFQAKKIPTCIWQTNYGEMARKTVIKRIAKYLPKTDKWERVGQAINLDNQDYMAGDAYKGYLDSLVHRSSHDEETRSLLLSKIHSSDLSSQEADSIKTQLLDNQLDPITHGGNYNQGDIKKHLDKIAGK